MRPWMIKLRTELISCGRLRPVQLRSAIATKEESTAAVFPTTHHSFAAVKQQHCYLHSSGRQLDSSKTRRKCTSVTHSRFFSTRSRKIAIVGSGPSGCYTAKYLHSSLEKKKKDPQSTGSAIEDYSIDIIERLPTPYGLVRYGVAPDHPEVKNVQNDFDTLFDQKHVSFFGNVHVGRDVSLAELREMYDAVVLAYGCESDRKLSIPGSDTLQGIVSAREFVAWYNGHPDYDHVGPSVARALGVEAKEMGTSGIRQASVVVVGQGNVALDCARILAKGRKGLQDTDIVNRALDVLGDGVADIHIIGRRGHIQGAFTIKELRELTKLNEDFNVDFIVRKDELELGMTAASHEELAGPEGRPKKRIDKLLQDAAAVDIAGHSCPKRAHLRFLLSPVSLEPKGPNSSYVGSLICERTQLTGNANRQRAEGTGGLERFRADLVLVSIGYKGTAIPGTETWFDEETGRMIHTNGLVDRGHSGKGSLFTAGWLKRGASGIIGTNIADAKDTVATILKDLEKEDTGGKETDKGDLGQFLSTKKFQFVNWDGYRKIVQKESVGKRSEQQPRQKITDWKDQLDTALH